MLKRHEEMPKKLRPKRPKPSTIINDDRASLNLYITEHSWYSLIEGYSLSY